jgi:acetate---CoA ligase (ADP-forming)
VGARWGVSVTGSDSVLRSPASMLRAASVAIVGASERARWPSQIFTNLRQFGYGGRIYLVNPRQQTVFGERCFATLRDIGEPVDHAMVIVPAAHVAGVLTDGEAAGVKSATIYASTVGDGESEASRQRGAWLKNFVATSRLRVSGPNCMGSFSFREKLFAYPNTELCSVPPGPVALLFQSGGIVQFWMKSAADRGLRFSYAVSSGNEADLDLADYLDFVVDDPNTRQIVLFIEGIRRPKAFMQAAARALAAGKPVLAIKTGATQKSRAAAASHTGAIGGDYAAYLAMCERYGIVNCRSLDDLLEATLAFQSVRLPKGPRIGFVTNSGGTCDLLYDYVEAEGAAAPDFDPVTHAALMPHMQEGILPKNPLDVGIPTTLNVAADQCDIVARDPNIDVVAWCSPMPGKGPMWDGAHELRRLRDSTDKPVLAFARLIHQMTPHALEVQEEAGFPFLQGLEPTLRAINALWFYAQRTGRALAALEPAPATDLTPDTLDTALAGYGIALPKSRIVTNPQNAADGAAAIGFPIALKIRSPDILHKTEAGGVVLGLDSRDAVAQAASALLKAAKAAHPGARIDGFLVQEMVSGTEAIVGARTDPLYGPLLLVGSGGILVELVNDAALRLLPVTTSDVAAMVDKLKLNRLLAGYRDKPPADRGALEATALALGRFYLDHRARIEEIEINPLMVRSSGAVAVDVRVVWREEKA